MPMEQNYADAAAKELICICKRGPCGGGSTVAKRWSSKRSVLRRYVLRSDAGGNPDIWLPNFPETSCIGHNDSDPAVRSLPAPKPNVPMISY